MTQNKLKELTFFKYSLNIKKSDFQKKRSVFLIYIFISMIPVSVSYDENQR